MYRDPLAQPSRIAFAGDWHADLSWARSAVWEAADYGADVLIHCGDFGYLFRPRFLDGLSTVLAATNMPLLFVDGNHEDHRWLQRHPVGPDGLRPITESIWHIPRGFRWTWAGIQFVGLGGAHSVDGIWRRENGQLWQPEERITDEQAADVIAAGRADVLISHDCPAGVDIPGLTPHKFPQIEILRSEEHRELLRRVVDTVQPRAIWHGHYHVRHETTVDLGYGPVQVTGLDANDSTLNHNLDIVAVDELAAALQVTG